MTAKQVVKELLDCFYQAHCESDEFDQTQTKASKEYCNSTVKKAFEETGGDIDNPTKESIINAMKQLRSFSLNFRQPDVVNAHFNQILKLVEKIN